MPISRGKQFEGVIRDAFKAVDDTSVYRLQDSMGGYGGVANICDYIVYHYPYQYFIECKSVHGNTLPFSNISKNQWDGMLKMSKIKGVHAGVMCWWIDKDITKFIPIQFLQQAKDKHFVSLPSDYEKKWILSDFDYQPYNINGEKKRVFFNYDMEKFFKNF